MAYDKLSERALGAKFPLSIATSLAFESVIGEHPEHPTNTNELVEFDTVWVNLRTLYRNLYNAVESNTDPQQIPTKEYVKALWQELQMLQQIIAEYSGGKCILKPYYSDYLKVERRHKGATIRMDNTDKQKAYTAKLVKVFTAFFAEYPPKDYDIHVTDDLITVQERNNALIFTHYPYDLLAYKNFHELVLLESHTGALKKRALWYTKFYEGKDLPMIPFCRWMLQIFGDKETFRPMDFKVRKEIKEIAIRLRWNAFTSQEMINYGLNDMRNLFARDLVRQLSK